MNSDNAFNACNFSQGGYKVVFSFASGSWRARREWNGRGVCGQGGWSVGR